MPLALTANVVTHPISWWNELRLHTELNRLSAASHNLFSAAQLLTTRLFIMPVCLHRSLPSEIRNTSCVFFQTYSCNWLSVSYLTQTCRLQTSLLEVLKHLISLCLSAVLGVWYPAYPGWETQEVWSVSWGVCVRCSESLFGHCVPVPAPAADHWPLPLTMSRHDISNATLKHRTPTFVLIANCTTTVHVLSYVKYTAIYCVQHVF